MAVKSATVDDINILLDTYEFTINKEVKIMNHNITNKLQME